MPPVAALAWPGRARAACACASLQARCYNTGRSMRSAERSRQALCFGMGVAGLIAAAAVSFWPVVGPSHTHSITSDLATRTYP